MILNNLTKFKLDYFSMDFSINKLASGQIGRILPIAYSDSARRNKSIGI